MEINTLKYYFPYTRLVIIKKEHVTKVGDDVGN